MRIISEVKHPLMRITILGWNEKFLLRYELDRYEQMFKFDQASHTLADIENIAETMSEEVLLRFVSMREQLTSLK